MGDLGGPTSAGNDFQALAASVQVSQSPAPSEHFPLVSGIPRVE